MDRYVVTAVDANVEGHYESYTIKVRRVRQTSQQPASVTVLPLEVRRSLKNWVGEGE